MVSRSMVAKEYTRGSIAMEKIKSDGEVLLAGGEEEDGDVVLPGFRFHPTDEELVTFYLRGKVARKPLSIEIIREMDIYKHDPWDLPKASTVGGEKEWYFFCLRGRKYRNSIRPNRVTGSGFWKATGIDRPIYGGGGSSGDGESIGLKKSLVYYRGSAGKGTKTDWMMHEFRLPPAAAGAATPCMQEAEVWTICRIFKRYTSYSKQSQQRQVPRPPAATAADSSSNTGSFESDGSDEYMISLAAPPPSAAPRRLSQHHQQQHVVSGQVSAAVNGTSFFRESMHGGQFQGQCQQWSSLPAPPAPEQKPPPMTISFHQNDHGFAAAAAANDFYKDGYLDEIARMMEISDYPAAAFYDCRYA